MNACGHYPACVSCCQPLTTCCYLHLTIKSSRVRFLTSEQMNWQYASGFYVEREIIQNARPPFNSNKYVKNCKKKRKIIQKADSWKGYSIDQCVASTGFLYRHLQESCVFDPKSVFAVNGHFTESYLPAIASQQKKILVAIGVTLGVLWLTCFKT